MEIPKNVLQKIQKLLNLADGAKQVGSLAEAENAAAKAQAILMEYNLSEADARSFGQAKAPVGDSFITQDDLTIGKEGDWVASLYNVIALNNLCYVIIRTSRNRAEGKTIILMGTEANRQIVNYFVSYLIPQIRALARKSFSQYMGAEKRGTYIRGFLLGCVHGIGEKLKGTIEEMAKHNPKITDLILVSGKEVEAYAHSQYNIRRGKGQRSSSKSGYDSGKETGKNMNLNKGVSGRTSAFNSGLLN